MNDGTTPTTSRAKTFATRTCRLCGETFEPNSGRQLYCTPEHRKQHHGPGLQPGACRVCGQVFLPASASQRYCTPEHRRAHAPPRTIAEARERLRSLESQLAQVRDQLGDAA